MALYSNSNNFLHLSKILLTLFLIFLGGCQLDQSLDNIRNTLFESENDQQELDDEEEFSSENEKSSNEVKKTYKGPSIKDDKLFTPEKVEDDKRLLDFFTSFFSPGDDSTNVRLDELNKEKKKDYKSVDKKLINKAIPEETEAGGELKLQTDKQEVIINETVQRETIVLKKPQEISKTVDKEPEIISRRIEQEGLESDFEQEAEERISGSDLEGESLAFFDIGKTKKIKRKKSRRFKNNYVGLLLPLTGEKRSAGTLVLNTFRYSLVKKPMDIVFKIYDTRGTADGAVTAAQKGVRDGVEIFIGPIFSYETRAIKENFSEKDLTTFFSLSPDLSNISKNIIVSGQNPEEQISCIVTDLQQNNIRELLLIHHNDRYGEIIKNSLVRNIGLIQSNINLSFLDISDNKDLNKEVKSISQFERRKTSLKMKKKQISSDTTMSKKERDLALKKLQRQLTLDSPFDALVIASEGDKLLEILSHLAFYDIGSNNTRIYGTSLWEDTLKTDPVFDNTFFATNLKGKGENFIENYKDVFSKKPNSVSFHLFDLIDFVNDFKIYDDYNEERIHIGKFTNSQIKSGLLRRETFIKKNSGKEKTKQVFSCRLGEI